MTLAFDLIPPSDERFHVVIWTPLWIKVQAIQYYAPPFHILVG